MFFFKKFVFGKRPVILRLVVKANGPYSSMALSHWPQPRPFPERFRLLVSMTLRSLVPPNPLLLGLSPPLLSEFLSSTASGSSVLTLQILPDNLTHPHVPHPHAKSRKSSSLVVTLKGRPCLDVSTPNSPSPKLVTPDTHLVAQDSISASS